MYRLCIRASRRTCRVLNKKAVGVAAFARVLYVGRRLKEFHSAPSKFGFRLECFLFLKQVLGTIG